MDKSIPATPLWQGALMQKNLRASGYWPHLGPEENLWRSWKKAGVGARFDPDSVRRTKISRLSSRNRSWWRKNAPQKSAERPNELGREQTFRAKKLNLGSFFSSGNSRSLPVSKLGRSSTGKSDARNSDISSGLRPLRNQRRDEPPPPNRALRVARTRDARSWRLLRSGRKFGCAGLDLNPTTFRSMVRQDEELPRPRDACVPPA